MKALPNLFVLLLVSQALALTMPVAHAQAQAPDPKTIQREDDRDGLQLRFNFERIYRQARVYAYKSPAYTVDEVTEQNDSLADGNQIKKTQTSTRYQDKSGRVRVDYKSGFGKDRIFIGDPNINTAWLIRPERKDILRMDGVPPPTQISADYLYAPQEQEWSKQVTTALGVKEIAGVKASGTLTETFYPAGARGNEKEMVDTTEAWSSRELIASVYRRSVIAGRESVTRYENLKLGDVPDAVFTIPADYVVRKVVLDKNAIMH